MRSGAWLCAGALFLTLGGACSGGYPLEPTPCDDWCDATHGSYNACFSGYDPARCVSDCEAAGFGNPECRTQLDSAIACYRTTPNVLSAQCSYVPNDPSYRRPCQSEVEALGFCGSFCPSGTVCL